MFPPSPALCHQADIHKLFFHNMLFNFQQILSVISFLVGILLAVVYAWSGHFIGAIGYLLAGTMAACFFIPWLKVIEEWWWILGTGIALLIGFFTVVSDSPAFDINIQYAQAELLQEFMNMNIAPNEWKLNANERKLAEQGFFVCTMQGTVDLSQATTELAKLERFGPIMSLLDGLNSITSPPQKNCLDYYRELRKSKPEAFINFESKYPKLIRSFSN